MQLRLWILLGFVCVAGIARADEPAPEVAPVAKPAAPLVFNPASEGHKGVSKHDSHATLVINMGSGGNSAVASRHRRGHHRVAARPGSAPRALR